MNADRIIEQWGARIERRRRVAGFSQSQLARVLGTTQQQVSTWEHGQVEPRLATQLALCEALGCAHGDLFGV